jgi:hypothetical protein
MDTITIILAVLVTSIAVVLWVNRPVRVALAADPPDDFPPEGFDHHLFEDLLRRFVAVDGRIDYTAWHASANARRALDSYLAAVALFSPVTSPERFPSRADALAYWLYGYNAWVIRAVLSHWPIKSVTDVRAPLEVVKGLGFFYRLRFPFGGQYLSLYTVENRRIRSSFRDPRIHFVLSCASGSCPAVRPELPDGDELEALLESATRDFVNDPANVCVDHSRRTIRLNRIFKWYEKDFTNYLQAGGHSRGRGLVDYVTLVAEDALSRELALAQDYDIEFLEYDWGINAG